MEKTRFERINLFVTSSALQTVLLHFGHLLSTTPVAAEDIKRHKKNKIKYETNVKIKKCKKHIRKVQKNQKKEGINSN